MLRPRPALDAWKSLVAALLFAGAPGAVVGQTAGARANTDIQLSVRATVLDGLDNTTSLHPAFGRLPGRKETCLLVGCRVDRGPDTRGRLRVLRNIGTDDRPRYGDGYWLDEKVPTARIPGG